MHSAILAVAVGILVIVAYEDVRTRRIPNALSLAIAALGLARIALAAEVIDAGYTHAAAIIIFAITFALFQRGGIGGGDAKILPATALLIGHRELLSFLFLMSLCGGVLALATSRRKGSICLSDISGGGRTYPLPARATEVEWRQKGRQCLMASLSPLLA